MHQIILKNTFKELTRGETRLTYGRFSARSQFADFPTWFSRAIISKKHCREMCRPAAPLDNIHPANAARTYFHRDVMVLKCEQEHGSSREQSTARQGLLPLKRPQTNSKDKIPLLHIEMLNITSVHVPRAQNPVGTRAAGPGCCFPVFSLTGTT